MFNKEFKDIREEDILQIEKEPANFESFEIEYKLNFNGDGVELRRDVVQFANGVLEGYIIFGISDDPIKVIGIDKNEVDKLKIILNDLISKKIDPILSPFPQYHVVPLTKGNYIFIIKIFPKNYGVYGIRQHEDLNHSNYKRYEFYQRMDGSKHQMNIEEIVELIESKSRSKKKYLAVSIHGNNTISKFNDVFISVKGVNKSKRPIVITSYGINLPNHTFNVFILPTHPKLRLINTSLPCKLEDGESCTAFIERLYFEKIIKDEGFKFPIIVKAFLNTNDGRFYSDEIKLKKLK
ncbi:hypothetical protein LCGC14_0969390 [marine sediment metagenome]|uniref:Schlafen AlbA-2 domain-containing protein n=1 Tax=marine sediment metagenome TaxID=412755 RepID=A0A0F9NGK3_9ZZZZ